MKIGRQFGSSICLPCMALLAASFLSGAWAADSHPRRAHARPASASHKSVPVSYKATPEGIRVLGDLTSGDYVWDNTTTPYLVEEDMTIEEPASLTIKPGVTVKFGEGVELWVEGRLSALGTETSTITLTGMTQTRGFWRGVSIYGDPDDINRSCSFRHVLLEYGGLDIMGAGMGYLGGALSLYDAEATLESCVVRESGMSGVYGIFSSAYTIRSCRFEDNEGYAVYLCIQMRDSELENLSASGNGYDGVALGEAFPRSDYVMEEMGLPYYVFGSMAFEENATLLIEPGVTAHFDDGVGVMMQGGRLIACGTKEKPIVLTGITEQAGAWGGVSIAGVWSIDFASSEPIKWTYNEGSRLEYVTIDYAGGNEGALELDHAKATLSHCIIRNSARNGIYREYADGTVIERSQIYDNAEAGIAGRQGEGTILACYNWWGDASGPYHKTQNPTGAGNEIEEGTALFLPFLTSADQEPGSTPETDILSLTVTPARWFVPADGVTHLEVIIKVCDGAGNPVSSRKTRLEATLGDVIDGDVTGLTGQAKAYVTSNATGDSILTPSLEPAGVYVTRVSPVVVTFTKPPAGVELFSDAEAPYVNHNLRMSPLPVTVGVPVTMTIDVTNPSSVSLQLDASFGKHNYGIGLPLDIIDTVTQVISANTTVPVSAQWTPLYPGHQCIGVFGAFTLAPGVRNEKMRLILQGSSFELPWLCNTHPVPAPFIPPEAKRQVKQVQDAMNAFGDITSSMDMIFSGANWIGGLLQGFVLNNMLNQIISAWKQAIDAIRIDPPRQDFRVLATVEGYAFNRVSQSAELSYERAYAINALMESHLDLLAKLKAMQITSDRYAGACLAEEQTWASQQAAALLYYYKASGQAMRAAAEAIENYLYVLRSEGVQDKQGSRDNCIALQDRLRTTGFNTEEMEAAVALRLISQDLQRIKEEILAVDPDEVSRKYAMDEYSRLASELRAMGDRLAPLDSFGGVAGSSASARKPSPQEDSPPASLVRVYDTEMRIPIANPLDHASSITMRIRKLDLPSDWMVRVTPREFSLGAGEGTTVTLTVGAGMPAPQGARPRVALEGYADGTLIGGVVVDTVLPVKTQFPPPAPARVEPRHWPLLR